MYYPGLSGIREETEEQPLNKYILFSGDIYCFRTNKPVAPVYSGAIFINVYQNHLIFLKIKNAKADKVMEISTIKINPCGISSILLITFIP